MKKTQTKMCAFIQVLALLLLTSASYTAFGALASTEKNNNCRTFYLMDDTNINVRLQTQADITESILEATDTHYLYQGSICFNFVNQSSNIKHISIYLENLRVRHVELINTTLPHHQLMGISGMEYPLNKWEHLGAEIIFNLSIPANTTETYKLGIGSITAYNSLVMIQDSNRLFNSITLQQSITGVTAGFVLSLVLYSLLVGFATGESTYFYLFGSTLFVTLLQLNDMSMLYLIWPEALHWNNICSGVFAIISTIFGASLARSYLMTRENTPRTDKLLRFIFWYLIVIALPTPFFQNDTIFYLLYALPTVVIMLPCFVFASIVRIKQGYSPAKLYLSALSAPVIAGIIIFLMYTGALPSSQITRVMPLIGTAAQLILFGIAIGERIQWIKQQKNISVDITLQAQAESSAKKNFLTHVSHELRTPLAGIIGLTEIARKNPIYSENKPLVEGIYDSAEALLASINMLLDHARLDSGKWKTGISTFHLHTLIESSANAHQKLAEKKDITITTQIDKSTPLRVEGEKNITQKVLDCVLDFSINNMSNGHILIKAEPEKFNGQYAVRIDVIDTGEGITENYKPVIFEIFEQQDKSTTRAQRGMGINLSLAKKLCQLLGGDMDCESNPLHGTAFWCHIPCRPITEPSQAQANHTAPAAHAATQTAHKTAGTLLVAEDDETLQMVITSQLEKLEKTFRIFPNGKPLVEDYIKNHENIGLILLDWNMPICNASQATLLIRDYEKSMQLPPVPIAILTAHDKASTSELAVPVGIHVLHKPISTDDLSQLFATLKV